MPSAANAKSEKPASSEAMDNSPVRQIITILEHKIRNLEKRKGKLTQYRDLQKTGKELNSDQRVAVAKYDEVAQTLEFARDIAKQIASIATTAERDAKKQAKKDAWVRNATETSKIREVLLILDCLTQMGNEEVREDFLNGTNGAAKLTSDDLKILDDLYPEVTPKHEPNEEGQPGFQTNAFKAAEHLCSIIDGKPKEILGTTYTRIKEIVGTVHGCGYFDRVEEETVVEVVEIHPTSEEQIEPVEPESEPEPEVQPVFPMAGALPVPPAPAVVPTPAYPLRPLPPITLQEVEHAYFAQQYPQQRPIAEVIGSQNFFFLQESEIDSPVGTPQPPVIPNQPSPPGPIPTQTFTNQHFIQVQPGRVPEPGAMPMPPQPHFPPPPEHTGFPQGVPIPHPHPVVVHQPPVLSGPPPPHVLPQPALPAHTVLPIHPIPNAVPPPSAASVSAPLATVNQTEEQRTPVSSADNKTDDWVESRSPERDDGGERKSQGQGDGQGRYRRFGRGGGDRGGPRGIPNGHRGGRGSYQGRQGGDGYRGRHGGDYQGRPNKEEGGYRNRQYDGYQNRHGKDAYQNRGADDGYYGNGDTGNGHRDHNENGGRDRYGDSNQNYQGGFKSRGRGGPRGAARGSSRPPRANHYNNRKQENVE